MENIHSYEIEQCELHPDMGSFSSYYDIPAWRVSDSSLVAWLVAGGELKRIPPEKRSEAVLWTAVRHDEAAYDLIAPGAVKDFRALTLEALRHGKTSYWKVPDECKDEDFAIEAGLLPNFPLHELDFKYAQHLLNERVAKAFCSHSLTKAFDFLSHGGSKARDFLRDEYVEDALRAQVSDYGVLRSLGKQHVLVRMLAQGFWPDEKHFRQLGEFEVFRAPPADAAEALERMSTCQEWGHRILHRYWLETRSVQEVVDAFQTSKLGTDELFEIYSEKQLRPFIKDYRSIRARFVETDLGM
jgi:hypothetical protein